MHRSMPFAAAAAAAAVATSAAAATAATPPAAPLQASLDAAIARGDRGFTIQPGSYNFSKTNMEINGAVDLGIVAAGVTLWFGGTAGVNITNSHRVNVSGPLAINYHDPPHGRRGVPGITYNLLNCTDVVSEDVTIVKAPFFSVTAFNGGGGHVFRRFAFPPDNATDPITNRSTDPFPHQRDVFHFTDLRRGVLVEDSWGGFAGDDFFNSHNTIQVVLRAESADTLVIINPHLQNVNKGRNTVYGTNCVLENLWRGDQVHFFTFPPNGSYTPTAVGSAASVAAGSPQRVTDSASLAQAKALATAVSRNHSTQGFDASDIWRVRFAAPVPAGVGPGTLVNLDAFSTPGTVIRNNTFWSSRYNLGRFKSNGGAIVNNTMSGAGSHNLEITPLVSYFEGNLPVVRDVIVSGNTITGEGPAPIHCSPFCGGNCQPGTCAKCALCTSDSAWAVNVSVFGNHITP